jgi:glutathionylspermidine synthase
VVGSWVTSSAPRYAGFPQHPRGGEACGIGIREDNTLITKNTSRFVPHYFL